VGEDAPRARVLALPDRPLALPLAELVRPLGRLLHAPDGARRREARPRDPVAAPAARPRPGGRAPGAPAAGRRPPPAARLAAPPLEGLPDRVERPLALPARPLVAEDGV